MKSLTVLFCAWVLWQHQGVIDPIGTVAFWGWSWVPVGASSTEPECRKIAVRMDGEREKDADGYFVVSSDGRSIRVRNVCFPDTIDPRGPKR